MVSVKALDELTLADLWREVPADRFWEDTEERLRVLLKLVLEGALGEEMVELQASTDRQIPSHPLGQCPIH